MNNVNLNPVVLFTCGAVKTSLYRMMIQAEDTKAAIQAAIADYSLKSMVINEVKLGLLHALVEEHEITLKGKTHYLVAGKPVSELPVWRKLENAINYAWKIKTTVKPPVEPAIVPPVEPAIVPPVEPAIVPPVEPVDNVELNFTGNIQDFLDVYDVELASYLRSNPEAWQALKMLVEQK